jgi:glucose/arabinose dehydrogenase
MPQPYLLRAIRLLPCVSVPLCLCVALLFSFPSPFISHAQSPLPPCAERRLVPPFEPWVDARTFCLELVVDDEQGAGELAYTALAVGDDGTLYAARPLAGEVLALDDSDGDLLPDAPRVIASGLTLPNALAWYDGALYIAGGANVYRWRDGATETLISDVPANGGYWTGGIAVNETGIYIATGGEALTPSPSPERGVSLGEGSPEAQRGAVLHYAWEADMARSRRTIATGLSQPGDLAWYQGALWTNDSAPIALADTPDLDEINRLTPDADFGFPACIGASFGDGCAGTDAPTLSLPTRSNPLGMAAYRGAAFPSLEGALLVALGGNRNDARLRGFQLRALWFDEGGAFQREYAIMPNGDNFASAFGEVFTHEEMTYRGSSMYPRYPFDVAISPEGWVYLSVSGGRIMALRPQS